MDNRKTLREKAKLFLYGCKVLLDVSSGYLIIIVALSLLSGTIGPLNAIVWQHTLDLVSGMLQKSEWRNSVLFLLILFSILNLASFIVSELLRYMKQTYSDMVSVFLTASILEKSGSFPMYIFDEPTVYDHLHIALDESTSTCLSILDVISDTIRATIQFASYIVIVIQLNWIIAPISIVSALPLLFMSLSMDKYWYSIFVQRTETNRLIEYLKVLLTKNENIKEVKLYKLCDRIVDYIRCTYQKFLVADKKARMKCFGSMSWASTLDEVASFLIKVLIVFLGIAKNNSIGTITLYFTAQNGLKGSIIILYNQISAIQKNLLYLQSLKIISEIKPEAASNGTTIRPFPKQFKRIELKNVSFCYPGSKKYILKNISIIFENGKSYSIVGLNGAGKTTLIKLLLRLYSPSEGQILIDGIDINQYELSDYYSKVGAVFQDFLKLPVTLYENITCRDRNADHIKFDDAVKVADITQLVENLPQKENTLLLKEWTGGVDISHGQWQRVAIARCCYGDCAIAILDEPFSSIDSKAETQIIERISKKRKGKLTIYITHQFTSISLADQIFVLKEGQLVEAGTHQELVQNKKLYYELYNAQLKKLKKDDIDFFEQELPAYEERPE